MPVTPPLSPTPDLSAPASPLRSGRSSSPMWRRMSPSPARHRVLRPRPGGVHSVPRHDATCSLTHWAIDISLSWSWLSLAPPDLGGVRRSGRANGSSSAQWRRSGGGAQWRGRDGSAERGLIVAEMAKACLDPDPLYRRAPPRPHLLRVCRQLRRIQGN